MSKWYYYVPPCPNCGGEKTGRFVFPVMLQKKQMLIDAYKNGELVAFYDYLREENAFCVECGHEWNADIKRIRLSDSEIEKEKKKRNVDEVYDESVKLAVHKKETWGPGRKFFNSMTGF